MTKENIKSLLEGARKKYSEAMASAKADHKKVWATWAPLQRAWEWKMFLEARAHYSAVRWPYGMTKAKAMAATYEDVISDTVVESTALAPEIAIN